MKGPYASYEYLQILKQELLQKHYLTGPTTSWFFDKEKYFTLIINTTALHAFSMVSWIFDSIGILPHAYVWKKLEDYSHYEKDLKKAPCPDFDQSPIKTSRKTYNHVNDFTLSSCGLGFFKPKMSEDNTWYPFYVPGRACQGKATEIYCDGANLAVVIEEKNRDQIIQKIYTKKVLKEWRDPITKEYHYVDLTQEDNWRDSWFHLPVASQLKILPLLKSVLSWMGDSRLIKPERGMIRFSHRGIKNHYYIDRAGKKHYDTHGVSQMISLECNPPKLSYADPWLPFGFSYQYDLPEFFQPVSFDVSASTIFLIGKKDDQDGKKAIALFLKTIDFDILGKNSFYWVMGWYTYDDRNEDKQKIVLPPLDWEQVPLPLPGSFQALSKHVGISQIGEGNDARLLTIRCIGAGGNFGYFQKEIRDNDWVFIETPQDPIPEEDLILIIEDN